jgi:hypothetical protein
MRSLAMILVVVLAVGLAATGSMFAAKGHDHEVSAEFVSFDKETHTLTFKAADGTESSAPVMESAVADLSEMKAGDQIVLTCTDDENGEHKGVSKVKRAKAKKG